MQHPAIQGDCEGSADMRRLIHTQAERTRVVPIDRQQRDREYLLREFAQSDSPYARPVRVRPGSEEKLVVLEERYAAHLPLWHPDDEVAFGTDQLLVPFVDGGGDEFEDELEDEE